MPPTLASYYSLAPDPSAFSSSAQVQIEVGLTPQKSLNSIETAISNPASTSYHDFLTPSEIASQAGVPASTYASIVAYFSSFGLTVETHPDLLSVSLSGTPAQLQKAFHTQVDSFALSYSNPDYYNPVFDKVTGEQEVTVGGQPFETPIWTSEPYTFYANVGDLSLPAGIAKYVDAVTGFGIQLAQPQVQAMYATSPGELTSSTQVFNTTNGSWSQTYGDDWGEGGYHYQDPFSLNGNCAANYSWFYEGDEATQLFFPSTMPTLEGACTLFTGADTILSERDYGQGITIAVVEVGAVDPAQLAAFSALTFPSGTYPNGLTTNLLDRLTYIDLGASSLSEAIDQGADYGWYIETALDIEYAATMAPEAHIDLVSVPDPNFSAFDEAYSFISANLVGKQVCDIPSTDPVFGPVFVYGATSDSNGGSACQVSITSNSYGSGETYTTYFGSPMYVTYTSQLLEELSIQGVTSFFANGDSGGVYAVVEDFMPADSPTTISVGGGQMTADDQGVLFPNTNKYAFLEDFSEEFCYEYCCYSYEEGNWVEVAPVTSLYSYTYWAYPSYDGTFSGEVGGGFGQSIESPQAWYQAGNGTYVDGARIDPTISNAAAFNESIYYNACGPTYFLPEGWCEGPWNYLYGGTSFATPISAGGWALIEEQVVQKYGAGSQYMGDIGPLLAETSNAWQAGATTVNPWVPMTNMGVDNGDIGDWAPFNSFTWYYTNLSIEVPNSVDHPWFADSIFNPAIPPGWTDGKFFGGASVWNNLQGWGVWDLDVLDGLLVGATDSQHALITDPWFVEVVTPTGLQDISELWCGETYTFEIVSTAALGNAPFSVIAYSGTPEDGTAYGGGTTQVISVTGSPWTFEYTPLAPPSSVSGPNALNNSGWHYGYFLTIQEGSNPILGGNAWNFQQFACNVQPVGSLNLCISDVEDICQTSVAEETMFNTYDLEGEYNLQGQANALVTLTETDGLTTPVESASVVQTSVVTDYYSQDPTLNPATYAPGVVIGNYLTDSKGTADIWDNAFIAEASCQTPATGLDNEYGLDTDGSQPVIPPVCLETQVYTITAYFNGLVSNTVTVYVEPQMGSFYPQFSFSDTTVTGFVEFAGMTNVQWVNVSVGGAPGEFDNVSFLPACAWPGIVSTTGSDGLTFFPEDPGNYCATSGASVPPTGDTPQQVCQTGDPSAFYNQEDWLCGSGVREGVIEIDLALPTSGPVTVSMVAVGWNDLSINEGCFEEECFVFPDVQYGIYWSDPYTYVPSGLSLSATGTVTGIDTVSWHGSAFAGAVGTLSLVSGGTSQVLASYALSPGDATSGTYALNTANLLDGSYSVVFTEKAPGAVASTNSVTIYAANQAADASALVAQLEAELSADATTIASLNAEVASLQASLSADNATIASLQSQVSSLQGQVSTLSGQLAAAQAQVTSLSAQISALQAQNSADAAQIAQLQSALAAAQATVSSDQTQIAQLQSTINTLQAELNQKKGTIAPAWYDTSLGGGLIVGLIALAAIVGVVGTYAVMRRGRRVEEPSIQAPEQPAAAPYGFAPSSGSGPSPRGDEVDQNLEQVRRAVARSISQSVAVQQRLVERGQFERAAQLNAASRELADAYKDLYR
ncbi:MAG TPA: protease pro-enzyme activation domain-containing protein [Thermoplasmata archaeon]|nr:protease pro-enzyme activation domain-containing protein [Thermoplasmata archaeon]